ncbi:MAG: hypothetical protein JXQ80_12475 [Bacteroidales bacterium]|nr:hypothetical protein [Bacteroidales bacterium]
MNKSIGITCLFLLLLARGMAQQPDTFPSIDAKDLPGAVFDKPKVYTGASLFGYMNGGAELYREYGCAGAWISELEYMGSDFKIEVFKMKGAEEAFGIYSLSRFQCSSEPPLSVFTCQTPYQLQICLGPYYINIINSTGSANDSLAALKIGAAVANKIRELPADMTQYLPGIPSETINGKAILVKGELGIMNGAPDLSAYFAGAKGFCAVILKTESESLLSVRFTTENETNDFIQLHKSDDMAKPSEEKISRIAANHLLITFSN